MEYNNEEQVQLNLNDIQQVVNVLDAAFTRGAFRGKEASMVGKLYDRLDTYLEQNKTEQSDHATQQTQPKTKGGDV